MTQPLKRSFASDNNASVHPAVLEAVRAANQGHALAYGDDPFTASARERFESLLGKPLDVHFVFNGTGANVLGLKAVTEPYQAILCSELAHIEVDECGAPERFTGCKLVKVPHRDGKITPSELEKAYKGVGNQHHVQPRVVSISQTTELGTVYTIAELRALAKFAHDRGMIFHMDGARIANAAAALDRPLREITRDAGVDVLSFGGTKNGMMCGEAVVFFDPKRSEAFKYIRKQGMQLASKMRYISAQFEALLTDDLWLRNARHANAMARKLAEAVSGLKGVRITRPVEANGVFAIVPPKAVARLQKEFFFWVWDEDTSEVRWMASFDTTEEDIDSFKRALEKALSSA